MTRLDKIFFAVGFALAFVPPVMAAQFLPEFRETFAAFGADLPWLTRILADYPAVLLVMPVSVLLMAFAWPKKERRGLLCLVMGSLYFVFGPLLIIFAAYLPIWKLGAAI